jgi:hypothetical protein
MWSAAMDVGEWLKEIGLGQYEATFREHEIDAEVLPELTEADLEKFCVPLGHRKRLIKAITRLGNAAPEQPPGRTAAAPPPVPRPREPAQTPPQANRRRIPSPCRRCAAPIYAMWPEHIAGAGVDHQQAIVAGAFARRAIEPSQPSCSPSLPVV